MIIKIIPFLFLPLLLLSGCASTHHSMQALEACAYPNITPGDTITLAYFDGLLENSNNKRAARWAKRKGYQVLAVRLLNNSPKTIHGFQLEFCDHSAPLKTLPNQWAAKKIRQRAHPVSLLGIIPLFAELLIQQKVNKALGEQDEKLNTHNTLTVRAMDANREKRKNANTDLLQEMERFEIFRQKMYPGEPVYGIVVLKSKTLPSKLTIRVRKAKEENHQPRVTNSVFSKI